MVWGFNNSKVIKRDTKCVYCESEENLTVDHVIPISLCYEYRLKIREANNYGNLVTACRRCNEEKADRKPEDFFNEHPKYRKNFIKNARYVSDRIKVVLG